MVIDYMCSYVKELKYFVCNRVINLESGIVDYIPLKIVERKITVDKQGKKCCASISFNSAPWWYLGIYELHVRRDNELVIDFQKNKQKKRKKNITVNEAKWQP